MKTIAPAEDRQPYLSQLAVKAAMLSRSERYLGFMDGGLGGRSYFVPTHPVHVEVINLLFERLRTSFDIDWDEDQGAFGALLTRHPREFGEDDFEVIVRAIRRMDIGLGGFAAGPLATPGAVGFGGDWAFRSGLIPLLIRHWDDPVTKRTASLWPRLRMLEMVSPDPIGRN